MTDDYLAYQVGAKYLLPLKYHIRARVYLHDKIFEKTGISVAEQRIPDV